MRIRRGHGRPFSRAMLPVLALAGLCAAPGPASAALLKHGLGLKESPQPPSLASKVIRFSAGAPPTSVDLTPYAPPVGDQGQVNSCAAWATDYTAFGYWENRQGIAGGALAPMYTYSQVTGGVDSGSSIESHLDIARSQGVDNASDYWQGPSNYWTFPTAAETANAANWKLTSYTHLAIGESASSTVTQQSIEQAVAAGDPVVIGIPVYANFEALGSANHGYYAGVGGAYAGGHAITVVGYDATGARIENSWSADWGDGGFATLSWSFVNQYVMDAVAVGQLVGQAPSTAPPANVTAPVINGTPAVGQTLTASVGTWSPSGTSTVVRWQSSPDGATWSDIGATGVSYTPQAADLGAYVRAIVTESNSYGQASATSAPVGPVATGPPQNMALPTVSGAARVAATLTAAAGSWAPAASTYAYQWQYSADGHTGWVSIAGARSASFLIGAAYNGTYLRVRVTATNAAGSTIATSTAAGPVGIGAPVNTSRPTLSGSARVGQRLTASVGRWSPSGSITYAWQRSVNGGASWSSIAGASRSSYAITTADGGARLRVRVTSTNAGGATSAYSMAVGPVARGAVLHVSRARLAARTVSFTVAVEGGSGQPRATAVTHGRSVRLRGRGGGTRFTFSGRLGRGRWVVTVTLVSGRASFVVVVNR